MSGITRIRFLPLTIFAATLMLTVKVGDIWQGVGSLMDSRIELAMVKAQQPAPKKDGPAKGAKTGEKAPANGEGEASSEEEGKGGGKKLVKYADDPSLLTQTEIDLLQQLAERREALESREKELENQSSLLRAAEARISRKVLELKNFQISIETLVKEYKAQQEGKMKSLVKIYESMKPKDAARIFEELDMTTLLLVAQQMKERKLAPVMAQMNPQKAKDMTVELSRMRDLPKPGG